MVADSKYTKTLMADVSRQLEPTTKKGDEAMTDRSDLIAWARKRAAEVLESVRPDIPQDKWSEDERQAVDDAAELERIAAALEGRDEKPAYASADALARRIADGTQVVLTSDDVKLVCAAVLALLEEQKADHRRIADLEDFMRGAAKQFERMSRP